MWVKGVIEEIQTSKGSCFILLMYNAIWISICTTKLQQLGKISLSDFVSLCCLSPCYSGMARLELHSRQRQSWHDSDLISNPNTFSTQPKRVLSTLKPTFRGEPSPLLQGRHRQPWRWVALYFSSTRDWTRSLSLTAQPVQYRLRYRQRSNPKHLIRHLLCTSRCCRWSANPNRWRLWKIPESVLFTNKI